MIGSTGGYVGPNLTNIANRMNPAWIEKWPKGLRRGLSLRQAE
jgi:hypothetical protein